MERGTGAIQIRSCKQNIRVMAVKEETLILERGFYIQVGGCIRRDENKTMNGFNKAFKSAFLK